MRHHPSFAGNHAINYLVSYIFPFLSFHFLILPLFSFPLSLHLTELKVNWYMWGWDLRLSWEKGRERTKCGKSIFPSLFLFPFLLLAAHQSSHRSSHRRGTAAGPRSNHQHHQNKIISLNGELRWIWLLWSVVMFPKLNSRHWSSMSLCVVVVGAIFIPFKAPADVQGACKNWESHAFIFNFPCSFAFSSLHWFGIKAEFVN